MTGQQVATLLVAILGTGAFTALIQGAYSRRKNNADATQVLNQAAVVLLDPLYKELDRLRQQVRSLERRERELYVALQIHAGWDYMAVSKLRETGVVLEEIPPLYPPPRHEKTRQADLDMPPLTPSYSHRADDDKDEA